MGLIPINLDDTPDKVEPIKAGVRLLKINDIVDQEVPDTDEVVHIVELQVDQPDCDDHERKGWERFNFKYQPARVKFKNLCKAAGHTGVGSEGVDASDLIGCTVKAVVAPRVYKDKDTGEMQETTQVKRFLWGPEADEAVVGLAADD